MSNSTYVLVTAVRNEETVISHTLGSVINQTAPPAEWLIVSDGSTDQTDALIKDAMAKRSWIKLIQLPPRSKPCLAARIKAITHGISCVSVKGTPFVGILDGDLRFGPDYYQRVFEEFSRNPRLGIAGGLVVDVDLSMPKSSGPVSIPRNQLNIPGAVQMFRSECFSALGGYCAVPEGGSDTIACAHARMIGYETRLITNLVVEHLKPRNVWAGGPLRRKWQMGARDYALGYHPLFEAGKCLSRIFHPPYIVGALAWWFGYVARSFDRRGRMISSELVAHIQREQMRRMV